MRSRSPATAAVFCCLAAAIRLGPALAADPSLWDGLFADGTRITGMPIVGWYAPVAQPQFGGKPMFDAANPIRWVVRTTSRPAATEPTQPFVELACGDRLPGIVEEHESGVENWRRLTPPHLLVRPLTAIDLPNRQPRGYVRVASEQVRRVVFVPRPRPPLAPAETPVRAQSVSGSRFPPRSRVTRSRRDGDDPGSIHRSLTSLALHTNARRWAGRSSGQAITVAAAGAWRERAVGTLKGFRSGPLWWFLSYPPARLGPPQR